MQIIKNMIKILFGRHDVGFRMELSNFLRNLSANLLDEKQQQELEISKQGILYVVIDEIDYLNEAYFSASSAKKYMPMMSCTLVTNVKHIPDHFYEMFEHIVNVESGHKRSKVDYLVLAPYENVLYVDSDTEFLDTPELYFDILRKYDVVGCHDFSRKRPKWSAAIKEYAHVPEGFSEVGGGVLAYRKTAALAFLELWQHLYYKFYHKTHGWDQAALRVALWQSEVRLYILPPEYNHRPQRVRNKIELDPGTSPIRTRIKHWHGLHKGKEETPYNV